MIYVLLLLTMIFLHIVDDFYLQGVLATMKQKSWWKENCPDELYKHDYVVALIVHGFSWSFMVHLPLIFHCLYAWAKIPGVWIPLSMILHCYLHASIDHDKANKHDISLAEDQFLHLIQIVGIWVCFLALESQILQTP